MAPILRMSTTIYIDDTGTPSQKSKSKYDSGDWSTWSCIILKPEYKLIYEQKAKDLFEEYNKIYGIKEFHFTEILSGKKPFRKVSLDDRLEIFFKFAKLYRLCHAPIIVQSLTSDDMVRNKMPYLKYLKVDNFDFSKHSDMALWFLLEKTVKHLRENPDYPLLSKIFIDEGRQKPNTTQKINILEGVSEKSEIKYVSSKDEILIQLIDFIAFSLNRMRWILMNNKKSKLDFELLRIISYANFDIINLEKIEYDKTSNSSEDYDKYLRKTYDKNGNLSDSDLEKIKEKMKSSL